MARAANRSGLRAMALESASSSACASPAASIPATITPIRFQAIATSVILRSGD
jgi:hypothetical protein